MPIWFCHLSKQRRVYHRVTNLITSKSQLIECPSIKLKKGLKFELHEREGGSESYLRYKTKFILYHTISISKTMEPLIDSFDYLY